LSIAAADMEQINESVKTVDGGVGAAEQYQP
jgi:hypothetical protein